MFQLNRSLLYTPCAGILCQMHACLYYSQCSVLPGLDTAEILLSFVSFQISIALWSSRVRKITLYPSKILLLTISVWCQRPLLRPAPNHNQQRERWRMTPFSLICVFVLLKFQGLLSGDCFSLCSPVSCWWKASSVPGMDNTPPPPCMIPTKENIALRKTCIRSEVSILLLCCPLVELGSSVWKQTGREDGHEWQCEDVLMAGDHLATQTWITDWHALFS